MERVSPEEFEAMLAAARDQRAFYKSPEGQWWLAWMEFWRALGGHVAQLPCHICGSLDPENIRQQGDVCDGCWYGMRMDPENWEAGLKERGIDVHYQGGCVPFEGGIACRDPYVADARRAGRAPPWAWARLPGLTEFGITHGMWGAKWCRSAAGDFVWYPFVAEGLAPFHPRLGRPWLTSERRPG
jgi:hypothetical protein